MRAGHWLAFVCAAASLSGCGSKESVTLGARVRDVKIAVEQKTLGTVLSGSFDLDLEVGPEASGGTTVSLEAFALARGAETLVAPLQAVPQGFAFPLAVGKGEKKTVPFVIDAGSLLDPAVKDALCAGPVSVVGAVTDTLGGGARTPLGSQAVTPGGC